MAKLTDEEIESRDSERLGEIAEHYKVTSHEISMALTVLMPVFNPTHQTAQILRCIADAIDAGIGQSNDDTEVKH